jgi:hypothetical protein
MPLKSGRVGAGVSMRGIGIESRALDYHTFIRKNQTEVKGLELVSFPRVQVYFLVTMLCYCASFVQGCGKIAPYTFPVCKAFLLQVLEGV